MLFEVHVFTGNPEIRKIRNAERSNPRIFNFAFRGVGEEDVRCKVKAGGAGSILIIYTGN